MRLSFRHAVIASTVFISFGALAAVAAIPPASGSAITQPPMTSATPDTKRPKAVRVEQRITELHARLQITPAQQPQWDQFVQVMRDNAAAADTSFQQRLTAIPAMTAPENMQSYATFATDHAQEMQKLVPAFQALYDTMSSSQKLMADKVFRDDSRRGGPVRRG